MEYMNREKDFARFIEMAKEMGAKDAKIIDPATVVTAAWVKMKCMYGCSTRLRKIYCCPPYTPTYDETREVLNCYKSALLLHSNESTLWQVIAPLEREVFLSGYHKAFGYQNGDCQFCRSCNAEKCNNPKIARPSMEACGIDVFATAHNNGFPIKVVVSKENDIGDYFGLILIE